MISPRPARSTVIRGSCVTPSITSLRRRIKIFSPKRHDARWAHHVRNACNAKAIHSRENSIHIFIFRGTGAPVTVSISQPNNSGESIPIPIAQTCRTTSAASSRLFPFTISSTRRLVAAESATGKWKLEVLSATVISPPVP